jgi:hypothetical protein
MPLPGAMPIDIKPDELELMKEFLNDQKINHRLNTLIKDFNVIRIQSPESFGETPCIRIQHIATRTVSFDNADDEDPAVHWDEFEKLITLDIVAQRNAELSYDGRTFTDIEQTLPLIAAIILRMLSENLTYENSKVPGITIDNIEVANMFYSPEYEGDQDFGVAKFFLVINSQSQR